MEEMVILGMLLCVGLAAMGLKMKMWPVTFISSVGWVVIAMQLFQENEDYLVLGLMIMVAIGQIFMVKEAERWPSSSPSRASST